MRRYPDEAVQDFPPVFDMEVYTAAEELQQVARWHASESGRFVEFWNVLCDGVDICGCGQP
ncbi:hypothetical protein D9M69_624050 [compost metagenome]